MRIAVIGNCQAVGLAACLGRLHPEAEVFGMSWAELGSAEHAEDVAGRLEAYDLVLSHVTHKRAYGALRADALEPRLARLTWVPRIVFTGFHPDLVDLPGIKPPLGGRHSALIMAAHALGLPRVEVEGLFNAYLYGALGYFDEYARSEAFLIGSAGKLGMDMAPVLDAWRDGGVFVHTPNHPKIEALWSMALALCRQLGLAVHEHAALPEDRLQDGAVWPVYPEIARRLGVAGSVAFKTPGADGRVIELGELIELSWRVYDDVGESRPRPERIEETMAALRREGI